MQGVVVANLRRVWGAIMMGLGGEQKIKKIACKKILLSLKGSKMVIIALGQTKVEYLWQIKQDSLL